jgi:hypothetical protein
VTEALLCYPSPSLALALTLTLTHCAVDFYTAITNGLHATSIHITYIYKFLRAQWQERYDVTHLNPNPTPNPDHTPLKSDQGSSGPLT